MPETHVDRAKPLPRRLDKSKTHPGMIWEDSKVDVHARTVDAPSELDDDPEWAEPKRLKICLACSHGGHLTELLELGEAFEGHDTFYFCYDAETTRALPNAYRVPNMARNPVEFIKNIFRVWQIFREEKPDMVVSTGAEIAVPVLVVAKFLRKFFVYIECGAQVTRPSVTGRIMYWLADNFYVQWPELVHTYGPRAIFRGSLIDEDEPFRGDRSYEKRMKVTMVQPAQTGAFASDQPPMGLAYIASILEQHGCEVRVIDANVEKLGPAAVTRIIAQQQPDMVCFTVTTPLLPGALTIARQLRRMPKPPILVAGGPHATVLPEEMLDEGGFDYLIRSEGEETMAELVERLLQGKNGDGIEGLSWRTPQGEIIHNENRALPSDLERYPYPDWSLFPMKLYSSLVRHNDFCIPITTSRGCPYGCTFCYKGVYGRKLRNRSPDDVVGEWAFLIKRYGAREIAVLDDVFTLRAERAIAICDELARRGLNTIPWSTVNGIRADNATPELMHALKRGGCYRVYFGIESGVQKVIDSLDKQITVEQVRNAVGCAKDAGLEVGGYFMIGNVGESYEDMNRTIDFAIELDPDYAQFTIATPYPGTQMYEQVVSNGQMLISSWDQLASYGTSVFRMNHLSPEDVGATYRRAIRKFYFRPKVLARQIKHALSWVGFRHRVIGAWLLIKLALLGGRRRVTIKGTFK